MRALKTVYLPQAAMIAIALLGVPHSARADDNPQNEKKHRLKDQIELEVGDSGLRLATCYKKITGACFSGYASGLDSACENDCTIGLHIERYAKSGKPLVLKSDVFIEGRLFAATRGGEKEKKPLANFEVKLYLLSGGAVSTTTDAKGYFTLKVESALRKLRGVAKVEQLKIGELEFDPQSGTQGEQHFYALALVPVEIHEK